MAAKQITVVSALREWWREERVSRGRLATLGSLSQITWEFIRDSMPDRRRQRFGDADYDWENRVDTTSANVSAGARFIGLLNSAYQPIEEDIFQEMLNNLGIDYRQFTFIDIGSGKGRALLMASEYPFRRVLGVELLPELHVIAEQNIRKFPPALRRCNEVVSLHGDATEFEFPSEPLVVFLFHPLLEAGFRRVLANLTKSGERCPRPIWMVYANPIYELLVAGSGKFKRVAGTHQYSIFRGLFQP